MLVTLILPVLKKYWKPLGILVGLGAMVLYIWFLRISLKDCRVHVAMFKQVQKQNEEAIKAQNAAIRKMWLDAKVAEAKAVEIGKASEKSLQGYVKGLRPVVFKEKSCEAGVKDFYFRVQEALK